MKNIYRIIKNLLSDQASQGQKFRVLCRFLFAHVIFLFKEKFVFEWVRGIKMYAVHHRSSSTECYYYGKYDRDEMALLEEYLDANDVFADIGSNIGSYALFAASCNARVIAVEPAPDTYSLLKENIALNQKLLDRIDVRQCALGNLMGQVKFTLNLDSVNHVLRENENVEELKVVNIPCVRLDSLVSVCNAIKIDVEDYELQVLGGAEKLLASGTLDLIIIETFDTYHEVCEYLKSFGFREYHYNSEDNSLQLSSERKSGNNVIFIKNIDHVRNKIQRK